MSQEIDKVATSTNVVKSDIECLNCGRPVATTYCPHCGQEADTMRITLRHIMHIFGDAFDFDHGLLLLIREMMTHPARRIRGYISGKRVRVFGPLRYLFVTAAILALLYTFIDPGSMAKITNDEGVEHSINLWASSWMSLTLVLTIPFYALGTKIMFRQWGYNFAEHLIVAMFVVGHVNILGAFAAAAFFWAPNAAQSVTLLCTLCYPVVVFTALCERRTVWQALKGLIVCIFGTQVLLLLTLGLILIDYHFLHGAMGLAVF